MPERRASGLRYDGSGAPRVVASGRGEVAEKIVALAREAGVPVREDAVLAQALATLELDADVPAELWEAARSRSSGPTGSRAARRRYPAEAAPRPRPRPTARRQGDATPRQRISMTVSGRGARVEIPA
jgi:flagellar biosynthesis protein